LDRAGWNDIFDSCIVPSGYVIVFYEHSGYRGTAFTVRSNIAIFGDYGWHDAASSVKVYYNGELQEDCVWGVPEQTKPTREPTERHSKH